ncbi:MAG TPA: hypothetical protein VN972_02850, partial [Methylomirabilota bacterium]|nr:hypothetical protein [Methylomirabilota bacterium]
MRFFGVEVSEGAGGPLGRSVSFLEALDVFLTVPEVLPRAWAAPLERASPVLFPALFVTLVLPLATVVFLLSPLPLLPCEPFPGALTISARSAGGA